MKALLFSAALLVGCGSNTDATSADDSGTTIPDSDSTNDSTTPADDATSSDSGDVDAADTNTSSETGPADSGTPPDSAVDIGTPTGPVYYVAPTGDDTKSGSITEPWKTVGHAMKTVPAGATVMVRAGTYKELVQVKVSGTASAPITLRSYPGEQAILDGTGLTVTGDQYALLQIDSQSHLVVSGLEVRNLSTGSASNTPAGIYVTGTASDVKLLNNHVHDISTSAESAGGNAFGVAVYGTAATAITGLVVSGNEIDNLHTGFSESMSINGNVDGFEVSNNLVHDNDNIGIDVIGDEGTGPSGSDVARNGVVRGNAVYNITSKTNPAYKGDTSADGIYVDGGQNVLIERNLVHNVDIGIEVASEHSGKTSSYVVVRSNVVYYSNVTGVSIGGYSSAVGGTDHCAILGNTLYANSTEFTIQFHVATSLFQDNVLFDAGGNYTSGTTTGVTIDHNLTVSTGASSVFVTPGTPPNGAIAVDLHVAAATLPQTKDKGVQVACPSGWTCPAVWGSGILNGSVDYAGKARVSGSEVDLGAYESP